MKKVRGANGEFFRDLMARGVKPVVVPREAVLSGRDLSRFFHHKVNHVLATLKKLYLSRATYEQDGQQNELVIFCQPKHMRCFLAVPDNPEARLAFQREIMQNREWRPRSEYLTQSQLQMRGLGSDTVRAVLMDLYNEKATYEKEGEICQAVKCYANGPKRTVLGLDNTREARGLFANRVIAHKKRSILKHRQNVCLGNGWFETVEGNIEKNTNLSIN